MKKLTDKQLFDAKHEQILDDIELRRGAQSFPNLVHKSDPLVKRFAQLSSYAFCAPALPNSLFYVRQDHKK